MPEQVVDVSGLVTQGCPETVGPRASKFIITGRGGLPEDPNKPLNGETIWTDLRPIAPAENKPSPPPDTTQQANSAAEPLVEASGWAMNSKGEVVLTTAAPGANVQVSWLNLSNCHAP